MKDKGKAFLVRIQELGTQLEVESKAFMAKKIADISMELLQNHEVKMNEFNAALISHHDYLEQHNFLDGDMAEVTNRLHKKVDEMRDIDILTNPLSVWDEILVDASTIRCLSLQVDKPEELSTLGCKMQINTCDISVKADEVIEPVSSNLRDLEVSENELNTSLVQIQTCMESKAFFVVSIFSPYISKYPSLRFLESVTSRM